MSATVSAQFFHKAQKAAESARILFRRASYEGASDRAFFAMFNASRALLASQGLNATAIRSHTKVRALLTRYFVKSGRLTPELAHALAHADKMRRIANLESENIEEPVASDLVKSMERFMREATALLSACWERRA